MILNTPMSDKEIIEEQKKTITVLQAENIRLTVELRKKKMLLLKNPTVELINKKIVKIPENKKNGFIRKVGQYFKYNIN